MADAVGEWLAAAARVPLLTHREELELGRIVRMWQDWADGPDRAPAAVRRRGLRARDRMVTANLRLVPAVARRYAVLIKARGLSFADCLQEGAIGLQRGVEKFDPSRGYKFSTFGYWWVRQAIARHVHTSGSAIRISQPISELLLKAARDPAVLAELPERQLRNLEAAQRAQQLARLDAPVTGRNGEEAATLGELLSAGEGDALERLHWDVEAEAVASRNPEAWAAALAALSRPSGLNSRTAQAAIRRLRVA